LGWCDSDFIIFPPINLNQKQFIYNMCVKKKINITL